MATKPNFKSKLPNTIIESAIEEPFITIEGVIQHLSKSASYFRVRFENVDGATTILNIPRKYFAGQLKVIDVLLDAGAKLPPDRKAQKEEVQEALANKRNKLLWKITDRVGWVDSSFVYYKKTFGPASKTLKLDADSDHNPALGEPSGNLKEWRAGLEGACSISDEMVAAVCIAASGPLFHFKQGAQPAIYHFHGAKKRPGDDANVKSSSGKTLSARVAQSMFGRCKDTDLFGFNMTDIALEETCYSCNNLLVVLDEEGTAGEATGKEIDPQRLPYRVVGGKGRRRSRNYTAAINQPATTWVVPAITTSEDELDSGSKDKRKEGAQVRMVPIPFPPTSSGGTFAAEPDAQRRIALAAEVERAIHNNFGVAMPAYLRRLVKHRDEVVRDICKAYDEFINAAAQTDSWERRFASKFAILAAASNLLVHWGIAPWSRERGIAAITAVYDRSRNSMLSPNSATDTFLAALSLAIAAGKVPRVKAGGTLSKAKRSLAIGVVRKVGPVNRVVVISSRSFRSLVEPSSAESLVLSELNRRGFLVKGADGSLKRQVLVQALNKARERYVCIRGLAPKKAETTPAKTRSKSNSGQA